MFKVTHLFIKQRFIGYMLSSWGKVIFKIVNKISHLLPAVKIVIMKEIYSEGLRKRPAGLVGVGRDV